MSHPLKELLERLGIDFDSVDVHTNCTAEQDIVRLRTKIADIPTKTSSEDALIKHCLAAVRKGGKSLVKDARKKELELEMRLLDKPDDVDLSSDEYRHIAMHLEEEQLQAEAGKREGQALILFCDLVDSKLGEDLVDSKLGEGLN